MARPSGAWYPIEAAGADGEGDRECAYGLASIIGTCHQSPPWWA